MDDGKDDEHSRGFSDDGRPGGAIETEGRQPEMTKDKAIVQGDVDDGFRKRAIDEEFALVGTDKQGIAHLVNIQTRQTPDADAKEGNGLVSKSRRMQGPRKDH